MIGRSILMRLARSIGLATALCSVVLFSDAAAGERGTKDGSAQRVPAGPAAPPPPPFNPYGTVKVRGANAEPGTLVGGWCAGTLWDTFPAELASGETWYSLEIPADDPATGVVEGCSPGETVTFTIDGLPAPQSTIWESGAKRVDLTTTVGPEVRKRVSDGITWYDANSSAAYPEIPAGTALTWQIAITNTNDATVALTLTDARDGVPLDLSTVCATAPPATLAPAGMAGASYLCEISDTATLGSRRNVVTATVVLGESGVTAVEAAGYVGIEASRRVYLPLVLRQR
jgi:hypothetical protein